MTKKKSNLSRTLAILLILLMIAFIALAYTYAKYTSSMPGTGIATIAKWDIKFNRDDTTPLTKDFQIDLASTMTTADKDNSFIQPGSAGSFKITVDNKSDVAATVVATVADNSSSIFQNGQFTLTTSGDTGSQGATIAAGAKQEVTVNWKWDYEVADNTATVDAADTTIGEASTQSSETICSITLSATQVDASK